METGNKVAVKIYGQEYMIVGDASSEQITAVAKYVDQKMRELTGGKLTTQTAPVAVLTAVNLAEESMKAGMKLEELQKKNEQLEKDSVKYVDLWEETKRNFLKYKEETKAAAEREALARRAKEEKDALCAELQKQMQAKESELEAQQKKYAALEETLNSRKEENASEREEMKDLEEKCREMESNFFELQMENIRLKDELDHYKKLAGEE